MKCCTKVANTAVSTCTQYQSKDIELIKKIQVLLHKSENEILSPLNIHKQSFVFMNFL